MNSMRLSVLFFVAMILSSAVFANEGTQKVLGNAVYAVRDMGLINEKQCLDVFGEVIVPRIDSKFGCEVNKFADKETVVLIKGSEWQNLGRCPLGVVRARAIATGYQVLFFPTVLDIDLNTAKKCVVETLKAVDLNKVKLSSTVITY